MLPIRSLGLYLGGVHIIASLHGAFPLLFRYVAVNVVSDLVNHIRYKKIPNKV